jgi:predicted methyltransferase
VRTFPVRPILALLLALSGCHLLDQTDFDRPLPVVPGPPPVPNPETRLPLVTIDYVKANPDYAAPLTAAIHTVEAQRPGVLYDVVAMVGDASAAPTAQARAAQVMTTIEAAGVIPARIQLGLRLDPGRTVQQVRVYLR